MLRRAALQAVRSRYLPRPLLYTPARFALISRPFSASFKPFQISNTILAQKEKTANAHLQDAQLQADFYRAVVGNYPEIVIQRYETPGIASNEDCVRIYKEALRRTGQAAKADAVPSTGGSTVGLVLGATSHTPIHVVISESRILLLLKAIRWLAPLLLLTYFLNEVWNTLFESGKLFKLDFEPKKIEIADLDTKFDDVKGCDEAKAELQEIVEFLKDPLQFNLLGGKMSKGVLLTGPPGTGKTLLARAVAGEAGVPFLFMSGSEFDEMYVGVGAKRVRELFEAAREQAPAIIFIDELDAAGAKRNPKDPVYVRQTLNQLLVELDGFNQLSGVVVIGATNFPDLLDDALTRPGRFDKLVEVGLPDVRGRIEILKHYMLKIQVSPKVDPEIIARGVPGMSGAELSNLVNEAAVHAAHQKALAVDMSHFDYAKDKILLGGARKSMVMTEESRIATAYHEAGHAIAMMFTKGVNPLYKVTVLPRGHALGITFNLPEMDQVDTTKEMYLGEIDVCMAGKLAEEFVYGKYYVSSGCLSDLYKATAIAKDMVTKFGMSEQIGPVSLANLLEWSPGLRDKVDQEILLILRKSQERTERLLRERRVEFERLVQGLLEYETLTKEESEIIVKGGKLERGRLLLNTIVEAPHKRKRLREYEALLEGVKHKEDKDEPKTGDSSLPI